ncbi:MAG: glycosyltransferase [Gammaproteobacteria bacterium]|nr:glycosyltransferase [Gammaproteobacteria bacterium]
MKLYILLATYNGDAYIDEQIASICSQTYTNWKLLIRDDGSTDSTVGKIKNLVLQDERIELLDDPTGNLGVVANFSKLAEIALSRNADYIMFCDQDDVWNYDKIEISLNKLLEAEKKYDKSTPILVHTDLTVVDENRELISSSFLRFQHLHHPYTDPVRTLLVHNVVTGSTVSMNYALLKLATPVREGVIMHDWWYALAAAVYGKLEFIPSATLSYRQHCTNVEGSVGFYSKLSLSNVNFFGKAKHYSQKLKCSIRQACAITKLGDNNSNNNSAISKVHYFCQMGDDSLSVFGRINALQNSKACPQGIIRRFAFYMLILFIKSV